MRSELATVLVLVTAVVVTTAGRAAHAADQTVLGRGLTVNDPDPGGDPARRKVSIAAREGSSADTLVGDPIAGGATLTVVANGTHASAQTFTLPPGASTSNGAGWKASGSPAVSYVYRDPAGANGPVRVATIKRDPHGSFTLAVTIVGRQGPGPQPRITVVPPAPGTDGGLAFTLGGGDTYCVAFGGAAGGAVYNLPTSGGAPGARAFKILRPTAKPGCPVSASTTTTVTSTSTTTSRSTTTTVPTCGNGVRDPGEACDPPGSLSCPASSPAGSFVACNADCTCGPTTSSTSTSSTTSTSVSSTTSSTSFASTTSTSRTSTVTSTSATTSSSTSSSTTSTPPTSTTSTTSPAGCPTRLSFTTTPGTTNCGGAAFSPLPSGPFSGAIYSDTAGATKLDDLGLGCLYVGGGGNTATAPNANPDGPTSTFAVTGCSGSTVTLAGSAATGNTDCTLAPFATKHCTRTPTLACTSDTDCGGGTGLCNPDARCYFGPPLPVPAGPTSSCIVNVFSADGSGTVDQAAGSSAITLPLSSRVYLTGNNKVCTNGAAGTDGFGLCTTDTNCGGVTGACQAAPACPRCVNNTCIGGQRHGMTGCTPVGSKATTLDCPPKDSQFVAPLGVSLSPLGTGSTAMTADASGKFCGSSQRTQGAFGKTTARRITQAGSPAGSLADHAAHPVTIAATFCVPATGTALIDGGTGADLPGPGAVSIRGTFQALP